MENTETLLEDEIISVIENSIEVDLFDNFWDLHKIIRDENNLLRALEENLLNFIALDIHNSEHLIYKVDDKKEKIKFYLDTINKLKDTYSKYEEELFESLNINSNEDDLNKEVALDIELNVVELFFNRISSYIELSENMEKELLDILNFLYRCRKELNESLAKSNDEASRKFILRMEQTSLDLSLDSSTENNKIINYVIRMKSKDPEAVKIFETIVNQKGSNGDLIIKKEDRSYLISILKKVLSEEYKQTNKIMDDLSIGKQTNQLDKLNKTLFIMTFIGTITAVLSLFYTISPVIFKVINLHGYNVFTQILMIIILVLIILLSLILWFIFGKNSR